MKKRPSYRGHVADGGVVLDEPAKLPEGTPVLVTLLEMVPGSPAAILAILQGQPGVEPEFVDEMMKRIKEGKSPASYRDPLRPRRRE